MVPDIPMIQIQFYIQTPEKLHDLSYYSLRQEMNGALRDSHLACVTRYAPRRFKEVCYLLTIFKVCFLSRGLFWGR